MYYATGNDVNYLNLEYNLRIFSRHTHLSHSSLNQVSFVWNTRHIILVFFYYTDGEFFKNQITIGLNRKIFVMNLKILQNKL